MTKKSKRIQVHDDEILSKINSETMKLWNKYKKCWTQYGLTIIERQELSGQSIDTQHISVIEQEAHWLQTMGSSQELGRS